MSEAARPVPGGGLAAAWHGTYGPEPEEYEPRYAVGDLIRDGLGDTLEITEVRRARAGDGISCDWAVRTGFASYELRRPGSDRRDAEIAIPLLHHLIDIRHEQWAHLGPSMKENDGND